MDERMKDEDSGPEHEKTTKKPPYEKPRLIRLEDEMMWSKGGVSGCPDFST